MKSSDKKNIYVIPDDLGWFASYLVKTWIIFIEAFTSPNTPTEIYERKVKRI
jgi:hypothetical protein